MGKLKLNKSQNGKKSEIVIRVSRKKYVLSSIEYDLDETKEWFQIFQTALDRSSEKKKKEKEKEKNGHNKENVLSLDAVEHEEDEQQNNANSPFSPNTISVSSPKTVNKEITKKYPERNDSEISNKQKEEKKEQKEKKNNLSKYKLTTDKLGVFDKLLGQKNNGK